MIANDNSITVEPFDNKVRTGGIIQINNLLVEVKMSDDNQGYIIDMFNSDNGELIDTVTIWKDDITTNEEE